LNNTGLLDNIPTGRLSASDGISRGLRYKAGHPNRRRLRRR